MFNIRNLVNRISQAKDGEGSDTSSNRSRSMSQASNVLSDEGASAVEAEGFLCPTCFAAFSSPDDLQTHYQTDHLEPGANYLCPVCKARLNTASDLELHYSANHSSSNARTAGDVDSLAREISDLNSSLNEERWNAEELRKEIHLLKEMIKAQGTGEEHQMYQQQVQGLQETKTLLTSEVVLLRKQLAEALESTLSLKQERERLEEKAAKHSQTVVQLQSTLDENSGLVAALQENIQQLEEQLRHKSSLDDAEILKQELATVQRLMDEMTLAKEAERNELQKKLNELELQHETLKNDLTNGIKDTPDSANNEPAGETKDLLARLEQSEAGKLQLEDERKRLANELEQLKTALTEKSEQLSGLQRQREETDVCVGHLREEVTSLQEMLNLARQSAEGQVSAKEDELLNAKLELLKLTQQNAELDSRCQNLQQSKDQLTSTVATLEKDVEERGRSIKQLEGKAVQLEEKIERLESERAELMVTIQKGEGFDTAIQQLQQDNARLQEDLSKSTSALASMENQHRVQEGEWTSKEARLKEELRHVQESLASVSKELEQSHQARNELQSLTERSAKERDELKGNIKQFESKLKELEETNSAQEVAFESKVEEITKLQETLKSSQEENQNVVKEKEQLNAKIAECRTEGDQLKKTVQELQAELAQSKAAHSKDVDGLNLQLSQLRGDSAALERTIQELKERIAELEPLNEALEEEKLRRIKEKAEWGDHEQLLRGEKDSLATLTTHLQQQLDEQKEEQRIQLQRFRNETDALLKEKNSFSDQLNAEREARSKDAATWLEKHSKLEEEVKELATNLTAAQDVSAARYQRCEELQASTEKYHNLKIELEARLELLQEEKANLQNNCNQWETEVDRLKFNAVELRRRLEDSQAALHELGRENQSLQMENAKLQGRKWADDSEVDDCLSCHKAFNLVTVRKHHCRNCGQIFCNECSAKTAAVGNSKKPVRVCDPCYKELNISPR